MAVRAGLQPELVHKVLEGHDWLAPVAALASHLAEASMQKQVEGHVYPIPLYAGLGVLIWRWATASG